MTHFVFDMDLGLDIVVPSLMDEIDALVHIFDGLPIGKTALEEVYDAVHIFDGLLVDVRPIWDLGF